VRELGTGVTWGGKQWVYREGGEEAEGVHPQDAMNSCASSAMGGLLRDSE